MQLADSLEVRIIFRKNNVGNVKLRDGKTILFKTDFDFFAQGGRNEVKLFVYLEYIYIVCLYDRRKVRLYGGRYHRTEGRLKTLRKA